MGAAAAQGEAAVFVFAFAFAAAFVVDAGAIDADFAGAAGQVVAAGGRFAGEALAGLGDQRVEVGRVAAVAAAGLELAQASAERRHADGAAGRAIGAALAVVAGDGADAGIGLRHAETRAAAAALARVGAALADVAAGAVDTRPWLQRGAWPVGWFPLRRDAHMREVAAGAGQPYPYVRVEGDGVHEIAVGPIHAGTIEPGHFRFSVVGEKVLRLEERLGYAHRGVEKRFEQIGLARGHALAARVSGDSAVAFAWAYCMACESAFGCVIPERAAWLRALLLERERVANHLGDLGGIANDAGLAFGLAQFSPLREDWQRLNADCFGHRLLMDTLVPGGVAVDATAQALSRLLAQADAIERSVRSLQAILDEHAGLQDRLLGTGRIAPELAARLGLVGLAGRASGQALDLRVRHPASPYDRLGVAIAGAQEGDVAARVSVRFQEVYESLRLIRALARGLPAGPIGVALPAVAQRAGGIGWVEGWRGEVLVALEPGPHSTILRCHCHDPSWQNWPLVEHAAVGNIVADFPLINKSFNLAYAGHDL